MSSNELYVSTVLQKVFDNVEILKIYALCEVPQGYLSEMSKIEVRVNNEKLSLFVKCSPLSKAYRETVPIRLLFSREIRFYEVILPAFIQFQAERKINEAFDCLPKYYSSFCDDTAQSLILENLEEKGYVTMHYKNYYSDAHMRFALKALAKMHSISFAMQDQDMKLYNKLANGLDNLVSPKYYAEFFKAFPILLKYNLEFISEENEKPVWNCLKIFQNNIWDFLLSMTTKYKGKINVISHGDYWSNNILFKYDGNFEVSDIRIIDFQIVREITPAIDILYCFYMNASEELLNNFKYYMKYYHECLSQQTKSLGTDIENVYPFKIFENEWKYYARFGYLSALLKVTDLGSVIGEDGYLSETFTNSKITDPTIIARIRHLTYHLYENNFCI